MTGKVPPRIYCIPATKAPIVAVLSRGPSRCSHVGLWDLARQRYESGAWLHGKIYPRRSDLSPDGRFLCYFAIKPTVGWEHGDTYVAVSKLPWLTALHAFGTLGTWTRGYCFTEDDEREHAERLKEDIALPIPYGLRPIRTVQFASERRRGWEEAPDSPPRAPDDIWDERRNARIYKRQPGGDRTLCAESVGQVGGECSVEQAIDGVRVRYSMEANGELQLLDDLQWADWDRNGHLLVATRGGKLQIRKPGREPGIDTTIIFEEDLSVLEPTPCPAPGWAQRW